MRSIAAFGVVTALSAPLSAAAPPGADPPGVHVVHRASSPIEIDGVLDEPAWADAAVLDLAYEYRPGDNAEPPVRTDGLVTFDTHNLYVAFRAFDPEPTRIRAHLMDRDAVTTLIQDDHVVLMIDPFNDERRAFQFRVNPLGVQADALFSDIEGIEDFAWDIIWHSRGRITEFGYVVEIAIPLRQIRFPAGEEVQTWGIELTRSYPRDVRYRIASHRVERDVSCVLCQMNKVHGFSGLHRGRNLEVAPTFTVTRFDENPPETFPEGELEAGDTDPEVGLSVRWGITPSVTLNGAINPDFSQVEADVARLRANERFALLFEERRPFFLEGIDFFTTPISAVFTRTVIDPAWGAKLTGKRDRNAGGVFVTADTVNSIVIPANESSAFASSLDGLLDPDVLGAVLRYRRDVLKNSTVGVLYAGREGTGYHNRVGGVDGFFQVSPTDQIRFQWLRSSTQYPDTLTAAFPDQPTERFEDDALLATYDHNDRNWFWSALYDSRGRGFRADSGFLPRVDIHAAEVYGGRMWWGNGEQWYTRADLGGGVLRGEDDDGDLTDQQIYLFGTVSGPMQSTFTFDVVREDQRFGGTLYEDLERMNLGFELQPSGAARLGLGVTFGDTIDFTNNQPADLLEVRPSAEVKVGRRVTALLTHNLRRLDVPGGRLFDANVSEARLFYHFNVRTFVRAIVQRYDIERELANFDPELRSLPASQEELFTQFLFSYKLNPRTVAFFGYSDTREGFDEVGLTPRDRTLFIKLGYAWLL